MPYAEKVKAQQFTGRKPNLITKMDQLARFCYTDIALNIRRNRRYYTYRIGDWNSNNVEESIYSKHAEQTQNLMQANQNRTS